jgi:hypothetical protein
MGDGWVGGLAECMHAWAFVGGRVGGWMRGWMCGWMGGWAFLPSSSSRLPPLPMRFFMGRLGVCARACVLACLHTVLFDRPGRRPTPAGSATQPTAAAAPATPSSAATSRCARLANAAETEHAQAHTECRLSVEAAISDFSGISEFPEFPARRVIFGGASNRQTSGDRPPPRRPCPHAHARPH